MNTNNTAKIQNSIEKSNSELKKVQNFSVPINPLERLNFPVSIVKGTTDAKIIEVMDFEKLLTLIKSEVPKDKQLSDLLFNLSNTDKVAYTAEKEKLKAFIIGRFSYRSDLNCKMYVPLLCFDIDGLAHSDLDFFTGDCKNIPYIFAVFPSPSRKGLRILVWCNSTYDSHETYYKSIVQNLSERLNIPLKGKGNEGKANFDTSCKNVSRLWFIAAVEKESFYFNQCSDIYELPTPPPSAAVAIEKPIERPQQKAVYIAPSEGENILSIAEKIELAERMTSERNISGGRNNTLFFLACLLNEMSVPESDILQYGATYIQDDFNQAEIKKTVTSAIKKSQKGKFSDLQAMKYKRNGDSKSEVLNTNIDQAKINIIRPGSNGIKTNDIEIESDCLSIENNTYQWTTDKGTVQISNFIIKPMYLLKDNRNPKRIFEIINKYDEKAIICVTVKDLTNDGFSAIAEGKGNFIPDWNKKQFNAIKATIYNVEKQAHEITVLGYQHESDIYAFANGILEGTTFHYVNDYGIVDCKKGTFFIPAFSKINEDAKIEFDQERKFIFTESNIDIQTWTTQFCKVYGNNGKIAICYILAALYSDIAYKHINYFPLLFLFGQKGTGKSEMINSIQSLFCNTQKALSLEGASSPKGFLRTLAQSVNSIVVFEEYKNHIDKILIGMLKNVYDRMGYVRAQMTNDNKTHSSPVSSGLIVLGQELPTKEAALFARVVLLEFTKSNRLPEEDQALTLLKKYQNNGLGNVLCTFLSYRELIESNYKSTYDSIYKQFKSEEFLKNIDERSIKNCVTILIPIKILASILPFPFTYIEVYKTLCSDLERQNKIMKRNDEINVFWSIFETLYNNHIITKRHCKIDEKESVKTLYIHFDTVYIEYNRHVINQNLRGLDKETLRQYLKTQSYFIKAKKEAEDTFLIRLEIGQKRCLAFDFKALNLELENTI